MDIISAIEDPRLFKPLGFSNPSWLAWRVFFKTIFALPMNRTERKIFRACTNLKRPPTKPAKEIFCLCGRRGGKSTAASLLCVWLACFRDWKPFLSVGETGWIMLVANDKSQAKILKNYISGFLNSIPALQSMIKRDLQFEIELKNNITIKVATKDFKSLRNYTICACVLEECAFWRDENDNAANPAQEVLISLKYGMASIPQSICIGISTTFSKSGLLYEQYVEHHGVSGDDSPLIWVAPTARMNPSISGEVIAKAYRLDPTAARSEFGSEFREISEQIFSLELLEAAAVEERFELLPLEGVTYNAFGDFSGGKVSSSALAISHRASNGKVILDLLKEIISPHIPKVAVKLFADTLKHWKIETLTLDRFAGEWTSSAMRDEGIMTLNSELSKSEIFLAFLPQICNQNIELLDSKRLIGQFKNLERKPRAGSPDLITTGLSGKLDDLANVAAGSCLLSTRTEDNLSEITMEMAKDESEFLSPEEEESKRITSWLLGGELKPPPYAQEKKESESEKRPMLTVSEWMRKEGK